MIDVAAFSGFWPWRPVGMNAATLAAHLASQGILRALVSPLEGIFWDDPQLANERLAEELRDTSLTLTPIVDPTFPSWRRDMESCLNRYGTRAVRILPGYRGFALSDFACDELLALAGREGIAVIVQLRMLDARGHNPRVSYPDVSIRDALSAAAIHRGTRIVLGGARLGELRGAAEAFRASGNLWAETSAAETVDGLRTLIGLLGPERLLFGTHTPLFIAKSALLKLEEARLSPAESRAITEGNASRLLAPRASAL